jgi:hypothetical protein
MAEFAIWVAIVVTVGGLTALGEHYLHKLNLVDRLFHLFGIEE